MEAIQESHSDHRGPAIPTWLGLAGLLEDSAAASGNRHYADPPLGTVAANVVCSLIQPKSGLGSHRQWRWHWRRHQRRGLARSDRQGPKPARFAGGRALIDERRLKSV